MKIPKKVRVAGHDYKVQWDTKRLVESGFAGDCHHGMHVISLSKTCTDGTKASSSYIEETLVHEILHCVDTQYNHKQLTEEQVVRLATGLYQVMKGLGWYKESNQAKRKKSSTKKSI